MLKVECESCKAPYQIDERRVPATGLKMRCPKCGHSFVVNNPAAKVGSTAGAPPAPAPQPPAAPPPAAPPARPKARTMIGVAPAVASPPAAAPPARKPIPSDFPAALGSLDDSDLPAVPSAALPAPVAKKAPPPPPAAKPPPPVVVKPATSAPKKTAAMPAFGEIDADLPAVAADLPAAARPGQPKGIVDLPAPVGIDLPSAKPAAKPATPGAPQRGAKTRSFDVDLPALADPGLPAVPQAGLPAPKRELDVADLPVVSAGLPAPAAGLPAVSAGLPAISAGLPAPAAGLPAPAAGLPAPAAGLPAPAAGLPSLSAPLPMRAGGDKAFGEIELPSAADAFAAPPAQEAAGGSDMFGDFGELDLPRGDAPAAPAFDAPEPRLGDAPIQTTAHEEPARKHTFGELDFEGSPEVQRRRSSRPPASSESVPPGGDAFDRGAAGGVGFGERDLGGGTTTESIATEAPIPTAEPASVPPPMQASSALSGTGGFDAMQAPASTTPRVRERPAPKKRGKGRIVVAAAIVAGLIGGACLELTPYGAFGRLTIEDKLKAGDYAQRTDAAMKAARTSLGVDTYDEAKRAVTQAAAAHAASKRALPLTAYAAFLDFAVATRFGADPDRAAQGKSLLLDLPKNTDVKYLTAALAAQTAAEQEPDKARKALETAAQKEAGDPIQAEIALLRGEVELKARDGKAALPFFQKAQGMANDARAHYGLARAYALVGDAANAKKEIDETLKASPSHAGALVLRAQVEAGDNDAAALKDLAEVIGGARKAKASPAELAQAYAARGWVSLARASTQDARASFESAVKLDPRNLSALLGQGELLFRDGRYTEALTRFTTALSAAPDSVETIIDTAKTEIALERLADAKNRLSAAKERFPKDMYVMMWLGKVETQLHNLSVAEASYRGAIALADPTKKDAVLPYVWLAALLTTEGKTEDAAKALDDAKKKLPDSAALQRALGEVAEAQSRFEEGVAHYKLALEKDDRDMSTHFRLGVTLRKMHRFDDAARELEKVEKSDKDYPGLAIERGQLYEESGDVNKAIDQFKAALAKAPDDLDLQLRVGSAYVAVSRADDAIPMLKKVLEKRGNSAEGHHYLGRAYMQKHKDTEALGELKKAVELDPNRAEYHVYYAMGAMDVVPPQLGITSAEVEKALSLDKALAEGYWIRGLSLCRQSAVVDGMKDLNKALSLKPTRYEVHAALAECHEINNEPAAALSEWQKAVAADENRPQWRGRLGRLLLERGNAGDALKHLGFASDEATKMDVWPAWATPVEFSYAVALHKAGKKAEALRHYRLYKEKAPAGSPDLPDAEKAIAELSGH